MIDSLRKTMCANVHNPIKNDYLKAFLSHRKHRLAMFMSKDTRLGMETHLTPKNVEGKSSLIKSFLICTIIHAQEYGI